VFRYSGDKKRMRWTELVICRHNSFTLKMSVTEGGWWRLSENLGFK
jgi:hypothetical protein